MPDGSTLSGMFAAGFAAEMVVVGVVTMVDLPAGAVVSSV